MPRVKKKQRGGAKLRKKQKQLADAPKRRLRRRDPGEEYAQVLTAKGNCRFDVKCNDEKTRLAHIRGSMRRVRIHVGDVVLVSLRLFEKNDNRCDIVHKYKPEEIQQLFQIGEIIKEIAQLDVLANTESSASSSEEELSSEESEKK